jgi:IS5 family transposase
MARKKSPMRSDELFRSQLDNMIDMDHPLIKLAGLIDWSRFDEAYGRFYTQKGRPALPTRLMAGLHLLKHMDGLSDEAVCARWVENPYWQYFCGEQFFRLKLPLDRSSMTRWRGRIGPDQLELLLVETIAVAMRTQAVTPQACERGDGRYDRPDQGGRASDRQSPDDARDRDLEPAGKTPRREAAPVVPACRKTWHS